MDLMQIVLSGVLIILAVVLTAVGIQLIFVLVEARKTLQKIHQTVDAIENRVSSVAQPLLALGGAVSGLKSGMKIFELFVQWLNRTKTEK